MMRVHTLRVRGRAVECDDLTLVQGTVEADSVRLELDEEWAGLAVTVAFIADSERRTPAKNHDGTYTVPWECLAKTGSVRAIVEGRGENGEVLKHARMERPFRVLASDAAQDAPATGEPTETSGCGSPKRRRPPPRRRTRPRTGSRGSPRWRWPTSRT